MMYPETLEGNEFAEFGHHSCAFAGHTPCVCASKAEITALLQVCEGRFLIQLLLGHTGQGPVTHSHVPYPGDLRNPLGCCVKPDRTGAKLLETTRTGMDGAQSPHRFIAIPALSGAVEFGANLLDTAWPKASTVTSACH